MNSSKYNEMILEYNWNYIYHSIYSNINNILSHESEFIDTIQNTQLFKKLLYSIQDYEKACALSITNIIMLII